MRPVPTKSEISNEISFPSNKQIHVVQTLSFEMMSGLLPYLGSENQECSYGGRWWGGKAQHSDLESSTDKQFKL